MARLPDRPAQSGSDSQTDGGERDAQKLAERGSDLAGALLGGAISLAGGPVGVLGGAAVGVAVKHVAVTLAGRLHARQRDRAGAALVLIAVDEEEHRRRGERARNDGFFDDRGALRPEAEELLEAVLMHAANAYEERKVPYLAHLYDTVAHDAEVSAADAHAVLAFADRLTYRQLVALAVLADEKHFRDLARAGTLRAEGRASPSETLLMELDELGATALIGVRVEGKGPYRIGEVIGSAGPASRHPFGALKLLPAGLLLLRLMRISDIPDADRQDWLTELKGER